MFYNLLDKLVNFLKIENGSYCFTELVEGVNCRHSDTYLATVIVSFSE